MEVAGYAVIGASWLILMVVLKKVRKGLVACLIRTVNVLVRRGDLVKNVLSIKANKL